MLNSRPVTYLKDKISDLTMKARSSVVKNPNYVPRHVMAFKANNEPKYKLATKVERAENLERLRREKVEKQVDNIKSPNYSKTGIEHTFKGEVKTRQSGKEIIGGGHYEPTLNPDIKVKSRDPKSPKMNEPYEVVFETTSGIEHKPKTMFPRNWTPKQVDEAIQDVYKNGIYFEHDNLIQGKYKGIDIQLYLNKDREIISGFPKFPKE